jgi:ATP diphosphatase
MSDIENLLAIMARLRDPDTGCPWDLAQSFASIVPHTIEEAYEVGQAIEDGDMAALADELGDLLFQIVFYARMAEENGDFDFAAVVRQISEKMVRRHPHVFGDATIAGADAQTRSWEALKAEERQQKATVRGGPANEGALAGVARALPALARAVKLQKRAARVGFDWPDLRPVLAKLREELDEFEAELDSDGAAPERLADEVGDVLFVCANIARHAGVDAEVALRACNAKFERRFARIEAWLAEAGRTPDQSSLEEMDALWDRAKAEGL